MHSGGREPGQPGVLLTPVLTLPHLHRGPIEPSHDQQQWEGEGNERWTRAGRRAGAAQVEQTSLEAHLPGVLPQRLPDGADFLLTVRQRCEGTCVESFPVTVANNGSSDQRCICYFTHFSLATACRHALVVVDSFGCQKSITHMATVASSKSNWALITMATALHNVTISQDNITSARAIFDSYV